MLLLLSESNIVIRFSNSCTGSPLYFTEVIFPRLCKYKMYTPDALFFWKVKHQYLLLGICYWRQKVKEGSTKHSLYFLCKTLHLKKLVHATSMAVKFSEIFFPILVERCMSNFCLLFSTKDALKKTAECLQGRRLEYAWNKGGSLWMQWSPRKMKRNIHCSCHLTNDFVDICNYSDCRLATSVPNTH